MPPDLIGAPAATTVAVIADWARLSADERSWLTELTVGSLGWGSRFGEEFSAEIFGPDQVDELLPSGVAMYCVSAESAERWMALESLRCVVVFGPTDGVVASAVAKVRSSTLRVVRSANGAAIRTNDWCVRDAAALIDTVFALQAGEVPTRAFVASDSAVSKATADVAVAARVVFEPPPVSLIIPTWNRVGYLRETILSCLAQTYPHCRVIVADDGSSDGTADLISAFSANGVRHVAHDHAGAPANRNRALATVETPYVMWVGDDDVLAPSLVRNRIAMLERVPDADVIHGDMLICNAQLEPQSHNIGEDWSARPEALVAALFQRNVIADGGSLISMRAYARAGFYGDAFPKGHDYHLWSRLALRAKFVYDAGVGYLWRWHGTNMGLGGGKNPYADCHRRIVLEMWTQYDKRLLFPDVLWEQVPAEQPDALSALLMAERLVREEAWADAERFAHLAATLGLTDATKMADALACEADQRGAASGAHSHKPAVSQ